MKRLCPYLALLLLALAAPGLALEPVSLQLRWKHQFQFAGYYLAKEKGYYREQGLDVTLLENGPGLPGPLAQVVDKKVDFGVSASGVVVEYANGAPVVVLAAVFQHSPVTWVVRGDSGLATISDLADKKLMTLQPVLESVELMAPFLSEGIALNTLDMEPTSFDIQDLISGRVDAFNGYISNEPYLMEQMGVPYGLIQPRTYGVDFYGDVLFTHADTVRDRPDLVRRFREASLKGWQDAMLDIEGTAALIQRKYATDKSLEHLVFEGQRLKDLVLDDLVPVGHMNPVRWQRIVDINASLGLIGADVDLDAFIYDPSPRQDLLRHYLIGAFLLLALLISLAVVLKITQLNRRLRQEIKKRLQKEQELEELARTDALTGLMNRRAFWEAGEREFALTTRQHRALSLIMVDLDHFKHINDSFGHQVGDKVLQLLAKVLVSQSRGSDVCGRLGGEEFALLLPETQLNAAHQLAERLRRTLAGTALALEDGRQVKVTMSLGVVERFPGEACFADLMCRADNHLYRAKEMGRDQVISTMPWRAS